MDVPDERKQAVLNVPQLLGTYPKPPPEPPGGQGGHDGPSDRDAERVRRDEESGGADRDLQVVRDQVQYAYDDKLGRTDDEGTEAQGREGETPPGHTGFPGGHHGRVLSAECSNASSSMNATV
nr:hypothetical protein HEP84_50790 [Streptomyces sp. RLB1-33]